MPRRARGWAAFGAAMGLVLLVADCGGGTAPAGKALPAGADGGAPSGEAGVPDATVSPTGGADGGAPSREAGATDATVSPGGDAARCDVSNCFGCCDGTICYPGTDAPKCGSGGNACQSCTALDATCVSDGGVGGTCKAGARCAPSVCPSGCCDANGVCQPGGLTAACGSGGASCQACPTGQTCSGQHCVVACGPQTCPSGCCSTAIAGVAPTCQPGNQRGQCGTGGRPCANCGSLAETCSGQTCVLAPQCLGCPSGCCDPSGQCQAGTADTQCGAGTFCQDCTQSGGQCSAQQCVTGPGACNQQTCPAGCCDAFGACQQGLTDSACGNGGATCQDCLNANELCAKQQCVPKPRDAGSGCSPACATGCCDTSTGACADGTDDTLCGRGGPCLDCTRLGMQCSPFFGCQAPDGAAPCSQTCQGCCDAQGKCQDGFSSTQCGELGATCQNCVALRPGSTCNLNVSPRTCTGPQMQCPAVYAGCPTGLQEQAPVVRKVCSAGEMQNVASACAEGANASPCEAFFYFESMSNAACANCLQAFDVDFATQRGVAACAAPYVDAACNRGSACFVDCIAESCHGCISEDATAQCDAQAPSGSCAAYLQADLCVTQALAGPAALCNPATYQGNFGAWLKAVGSAYCGP